MTTPHNINPRGRWLAGAVHVFTALGVVCALFAVVAISRGAFEEVFVWLGLAFLIDAFDGMLARKVGVKERLPRFSGDVLDLVIDYLTYVFVPVLALLAGGILTGPLGFVLAAAILVSSLFHFADTESKSAEFAFIGFPAIWNIVAFYLFAFAPNAVLVVVTIVTFIVLTFVRWPWVHPLRVKALRPLTLAIAALWFCTAIWVLWHGFPTSLVAGALLLFVVTYALTLSLFWRRLPGHS